MDDEKEVVRSVGLLFFLSFRVSKSPEKENKENTPDSSDTSHCTQQSHHKCIEIHAKLH